MSHPPFTLTPNILNTAMQIMQLLGVLDGLKMSQPEVALRKSNRIKTIQASLAIEGNTLSIDQVTDIIDGVAVLAPESDILEVKNAIEAYEQIDHFNYASILDFKKAHKILMKGLKEDAGLFRAKNVGVYAGSKVAHVAPQAKRVDKLMSDLFHFLKKKDDISLLIKSCVFHYELEFIHPFSDGNGRMGRLWQHLILSKFHDVFRYIAIESLIKEEQQDYYGVLGECDAAGDSTKFIEFCLGLIKKVLLSYANSAVYKPKTSLDRLKIAKEKLSEIFSRKEYMELFKNISTATASRDLKLAVDQKILTKVGDKRVAAYRFN